MSKGLLKLTEECGELIQIASKKMAFMDTDVHPDGAGSMSERLENEIGDVLAITRHAAEQLLLDIPRIENRMHEKLKNFRKWNTQ